MTAVRPLHGSAVDLPADGQGQGAHAGCPVSGERAWTPVARADQLSGNGPFALSANGIAVVVLRTPTGLRAYEGRCPHQGALLGEGELEGDEIVCRNHRWRFDAETGARRGESQCLRACSVAVREGQVYVDARSLKRDASFLRAKSRTIASLQGPRGLPLVGNMLDLNLRRMHLTLERWASEYGPAYRIRLGRRDVVVLADSAQIQQVLRDCPQTYRRISSAERVFGELGIPGVFSAEGGQWSPLRRLTMDALANRNLRGFYPTLRDMAERLLGRWQSAADLGHPVDIFEDLKRFAIDVTTQLTFGHDARSLEGDSDFIQRKLDLVFPILSRRLTAYVPYWRLVRLPSDRRVDRALDDLREWLDSLVDGARRAIQEDASRVDKPRNFLEAMIAARDEQGQPSSKAAILGNLLQILLAGEDTTASTLAWAAHELCERRDVVSSLREELDRVVGGDPVPLTLEATNSLVYATAVANEVMRVRPIVPMLFMENSTDVVIGDCAMPAGSWIWLVFRPASLNDASYSEPLEIQSAAMARWGVSGHA